MRPSLPLPPLLAGRRRLAGLAAVAVVAVALGAALGSAVIDSPKPGSQPPRSGEPAVPSGFVGFRDDDTGVSIAYPRGWRRLESADPEVRLVAADGSGGSLLVRAVDVGFDVRTGDLASVRRYTDRAVMSNRSVRLVAEPKPVDLGGLRGWYYVYTFRDRRTRERGAHSHYLVFRGRTMFALVFQALPGGEFERLSPVFDEVAATFRARP